MSNIADKISKLIAKAESSTHPEEADTFMSKAHEIMRQHGLSMLDLGTLQSDDPITTASEAGTWYRAENCFKNMGAQLARYYGCKVMFEQIGRNKFAFGVAGRQSAIITFTMMFPFVKSQVRKLAKEGHKNGDFDSVSKGVTSIANALSFRLQKMIAEQRQEQKPSDASNPNALVPVDLITSAFEQEWPHLIKSRATSIKTTAAGRAAAGRVSLNRQTGGSTVRQIGR